MELIYTTIDSYKKAKSLSTLLIQEGLAACVNIIENSCSIYKWQGKIVSEKEFVLLIKTKQSILSKTINRIKNEHSYSTPCIIIIPGKANPEYEHWINSVTK